MTEESSLEDSDYEQNDDRRDIPNDDGDDDENETLVANANYHDAASMQGLTGDLEADVAAIMREEVKSELNREEWIQEDDDFEDVNLSALHSSASSSEADVKTGAPVKWGSEREPSLHWSSMTQLVRLRQNAAITGEDVLRIQGIKQKEASKRRRTVKDLAAYRKGKQDGKWMKMRVAIIEEGRASISGRPADY
ncbi:MAG: hypothetical protein OHK93_005882 [Ramalina farinacea]|uniref:Uncharacterized protein n=1 Tax=Ramalina farinacea TaxID=258253 RepID=A0AA43QLS4_9LECA|nr:hypothetical protein [Ramalina farinacea]